MNIQNLVCNLLFCCSGLVFCVCLAEQESVYSDYRMMSSLKVERILNSPISEVAKGPFWTNGSLFYIDILAGKLHRYDYNADTFYTAIIREYLITFID